jgi:ParB/RepB/Spo0J family partition protein
MSKLVPIFKELPLTQIEQDQDQPRKDFSTDGDENRLFTSIRDLGIQQPIAVSQVGVNRYIILDGHRRCICAQRAGLKTVPCLIYGKMPVGEFERLRFEIQNNRRDWKPLERSEALNRIKGYKGFNTNRELSELLHLSETVIGASLQIRAQKLEYISLMEKHELPASYRVEFVRLKPRIRKIKNFEQSRIIEILFEKVQCKVLKNAKDFRRVGKIFQRAYHNEEAIYKFLKDPDMTVDELDQLTTQSGSSLLSSARRIADQEADEKTRW